MTVLEKLSKLRECMAKRNFDAYIIPTDDFHASEYVGDYFKSREFMSGFTGSAGTLVVLKNKAALWTDGRYFLQADSQLKGSSIELMKSGRPSVLTISQYLFKNLEEGATIAFDGRTVSEHFVRQLSHKTNAKKMKFVGDEDLVDIVWTTRPAISKKKVWELEVGATRKEKLEKLRGKLEELKADVFLETSLDNIAYLLNLRGNDVLYTPVFLSYLLVFKEKAVVFLHKEIVSTEIEEKLLKDGVVLADYHEVTKELSLLEDRTILLDKGIVNFQLVKSLPTNCKQIDRISPLTLMKAVKNSEEMENIRKAHIKDGVAVTKFIYWLKHEVGKENVTELTASKKLLEFRSKMEGFLDLSFESIIAYGPHGAIVHYAPTKETDVVMKPCSFCLADTGGHYKEGTTDITRTIALGTLTEEEKKDYTLVLKGHLNLAAAKFIKGVCGSNLDYLARSPLWEHGLDFNHGTGHGVGYLLSVHEGPHSIHWNVTRGRRQVPFEEGMIVSDEPGLYITDKFGIRHENLLLCRNGEKNEYGQFLYFENLTMVPFDKEAIDVSLMTKEELKKLNDYHRQVYQIVSPYLEEKERIWLQEVTSELC